MQSIKYMLVYDYTTRSEICGKIILKIDKMSRIFFFTEKKYFSISFPFNVSENDGIKFSSKYIPNIDNEITSEIISLLRCNEENSINCIYEFIEPILEFTSKTDYIGTLINELIFNEDGYLRYDYDEVHQSAKLHPLYHYDIFYSNHSTFKIGLNNNIEFEKIIDLVNINTDCHFIN
ncbi:hypothetical protein [Aliarcobacter butzleri]